MPKSKGKNLLPNCGHRAKTSDCRCNRATYKLFDYSLEHLNESVVWTHRGCVCNELVALRERHQLDTGARYSAASNAVSVNIEELVIANAGRFPELKRNTFSVVISHYSGGKRAEYERARESLLIDPLVERDSRLRMFLKDDKYHTWDFKAPRCIQFRSKRYGLTLSSYLQPIEEFTYELKDTTDSHVFAKSRNLDERANDLRTKWDSFVDPIAYCLDHSKFDCHVNVELLNQEHRYYRKFYQGDAGFRKLLSQQINNRGSTKNGTTYKTCGTRMSGDPNTGLGNSILNYGMLKEAFKKVRAAYYIDGDDSVVIIESVDQVNVNVNCFKDFGMSTKVEVATIFEHTEFCQCRPVYDGFKWHLVRNPHRTLARLPWIVKKNHLSCKSRYIKSVGLCELALNMGIPVLQQVASLMVERGEGKYLKTDRHFMAKRAAIKPWHARKVPIREVTRESFEIAWGISREEQLELERMTLSLPQSDAETLFYTHLAPGVTHCEC